MPVDSRSPNRNYPIPNAANLISEDFPRLITAINAVDTDVHGLLSSVAARALLAHSHTIADVSGLQAALDGKLPVGTTYTLASLTDVNVAGVSTGQFLVRGATQWQPSTFNPANYAPLAGATFTGGISGTTAAFTGIVEGAAATSGGHLLNRTTADARYDRILTSPTALTGGATIPSTENGRFYSLALSTHQTCSLPLTTGLPDGFSCVLRVTGAPSAFQSSFISGNGKSILYRDSSVTAFVFVGNGEVFRFTWLSGLDRWLAECLVQPNVNAVIGNATSNVNGYNTSPTAWAAIIGYLNQQAVAPYFQVNSSQFMNAAAGVYQIRGTVGYYAGGGGGVTGVGYCSAGVSNSIATNRGYAWAQANVGTGDSHALNIAWTEQLTQAEVRAPWILASISGLYLFLSSNNAAISLVSR